MHWACQRCWWETASADEMEQHERTAHPEAEVGDGSMVCRYCGKPGAQPFGVARKGPSKGLMAYACQDGCDNVDGAGGRKA